MLALSKEAGIDFAAVARIGGQGNSRRSQRQLQWRASASAADGGMRSDKGQPAAAQVQRQDGFAGRRRSSSGASPWGALSKT